MVNVKKLSWFSNSLYSKRTKLSSSNGVPMNNLLWTRDVCENIYWVSENCPVDASDRSCFSATVYPTVDQFLKKLKACFISNSKSPTTSRYTITQNRKKWSYLMHRIPMVSTESEDQLKVLRQKKIWKKILYFSTGAFLKFSKRQGREDPSCRQQFVVVVCIDTMGKQQSNVAYKKRFWNTPLTTWVHVSVWFDLVDNSFISSKAKNSVFFDKICNFFENKDLHTQTQSVFQSILNNSFFQNFFVKNFGEKINFPKMPVVLETFLKKKMFKKPQDFLLS